MSVLHRFVEAKHDIEELRALIRGGENPNSKDRLERTPLVVAVERCEKNPQLTNEILLVVRELINFGANVDQGNYVDMAPLHLAVVSKNYKMMEALLQANADIDKIDCRGWTALHFATRVSHSPELAVVKLLLKYKPDVNIQTKNNETPLMFAVQTNNLYIVLELLKKEASVTILDNCGETAMHYALKQQVVSENVVFELARHGCSFDTTNADGFTPREIYLDRLYEIQTTAEKQCAIKVIKLFVLDRQQFTLYETRSIHRFDIKNYKFKMSRFVDLFYKVVEKMRKDELAPNCTVYDIAFRGAFRRNNENDDRFTVEAFDAVLNRLIKGLFPDYCNMILSGICSSYLNRKFAGMLSNTVSDIKIFDFDLLFLLSKYLQKADKLNMMIACCRDT